MTDEISAQDREYLAKIRSNVNRFLAACAARYATPGRHLLDIAPQVHEGARPYFSEGVLIETLDIDPKSGCDHIGDICRINHGIPSASFDYVVCTEVLEHVRQPFDAVQEIERLLIPGGYAFVTTPFNFRIHGPLPDCWRFTEHGLRELFRRFEIIELVALEATDRFLMPIHYTLVARKHTYESGH